MQYVALHTRVNTVMAHRDVLNLQRRNILNVSMHFMMTERLQTIALAALLLDEEKRNEDTLLRTQKRSCWVRSWLQRWEEKGCYHNLFK